MPKLVRAVIGDSEVNVSPEYAKSRGLQVLDDEPTHLDDGRQRPETRRGGRPAKPRTTVTQAAAKKAAAKKAAAKKTSPAKKAAAKKTAQPAPTNPSSKES